MTADGSGAPLGRAEQRAQDAAERAEFDALLSRLRAHQPDFDCFCGSLEDLRRTVADLDRRAHRSGVWSSRSGSVPTWPAAEDPQLGARLAVARAIQRAGHREDADLAVHREQLQHWYRHDARFDDAPELADTGSVSGGDGDD